MGVNVAKHVGKLLYRQCYQSIDKTIGNLRRFAGTPRDRAGHTGSFRLLHFTKKRSGLKNKRSCKVQISPTAAANQPQAKQERAKAAAKAEYGIPYQYGFSRPPL